MKLFCSGLWIKTVSLMWISVSKERLICIHTTSSPLAMTHKFKPNMWSTWSTYYQRKKSHKEAGMYPCLSLFHWCSHQSKGSHQTGHYPWIDLKICLLIVSLEKRNTLVLIVAFLGTGGSPDCRETTHWEDTTLLTHLTTREEWSRQMTSRALTNSAIQSWNQSNQKAHSSQEETTRSIVHHLVSEEEDSVEASEVSEEKTSFDRW